LFRYPGITQSMDAHFIAFSYGRRVTGRLALQLFGGPEFLTITIPGQSDIRSMASGGASATYRWLKTETSITYWRGLTAGSGVLTGAQTDVVSARLSRQLTRAWSGALAGSLHANSAVPRPNSGTATQTYDYWTGAADLTRRLGHFARLSLFYSYQTQNSNQAFSSGDGSGQSFSRHIFGAAFNFDYRPLGI